MKKLVLILSGWFFTVSTFAQDATPAEKTFVEDPMLPYYLAFGFILIAAILVAMAGVYVVRILDDLTEQAKKEKAAKVGIAYVPTPGWWAQFSQKINASVPVTQEKNIELDHNYDGIKELDNHLPPWWKWLFYGTIGWSVVYVIVFHFSSSLPLSIEEYQDEVAIAAEQQRQRIAAQPQLAIDENNLQFINDPAMIEKGKKVFASNPCGSCHRNDGGGNAIGPNLTDEYWIHGGEVKNIFNTIKNGAVDKGMPAWGKGMSAQDVRDLTFYVMSLQGTNPPNAKAPQGELFKQTAPLIADSTKTQAKL